MGGWRFGNTINGTQAEYVVVPDAMANLALVPNGLSDEQVLICSDIMSTGFAGAEGANIRIGDAVAVFAKGPTGLCATAGAKLTGASTIIGVDTVPARLEMARAMGADHVVDFGKADPVDEIMKIADWCGVEVAIEALRIQSTFEARMRILKPGGTLSSLGVYSGNLRISLGTFHAGLADNKIVKSLCPGGKEQMRWLMNVIFDGLVDLEALVTHRYRLDEICAVLVTFRRREFGYHPTDE